MGKSNWDEKLEANGATNSDFPGFLSRPRTAGGRTPIVYEAKLLIAKSSYLRRLHR
jgi:hypothetical protein